MRERMDGILTGGLLFITGMLVGVGTGLLIAPESGARTRRRLKRYAEDMGEHISDFAEDTRTKVEDLVDRGKELVTANASKV